MSHPLLERAQAFITREKLFPENASLLVAVSGGIDSMVLLHLLWSLKYSVSAAHVNYRLRGEESDNDAKFVATKATELGIPFDYRSSNADELHAMRTGNLQSIARKIRYEWLQELAKKRQVHHICTAHHLDDNLETTLLQLTRGTALTGLTGMQPKLENGICRPLLDAPRKMIEDYARHHQLSWREDRSNATDDYNRNRLRHQVLPSLHALLPDAHQRLATTFERLRAEEKLFLSGLDLLWAAACVGPNRIDRKLLPEDRQAAIRLLHHQLRPYGFKGDHFRQMLEATSGTTIKGKTADVYIRKGIIEVAINQSDL